MRKSRPAGELYTVVELARGRQIASERLFDNHARMLGQLRGTKLFDHCLEERRGDREVVRWAPSVTQFFFQRCEGARIFVIPAHVPEQGQKTVQTTLVINPARSLDAVGHTSVQTLEAPLGEGDTDYRDLEDIAFHHGIECREDHLVGEIACHAVEHQRVRAGGRHRTRPFLGAAS